MKRVLASIVIVAFACLFMTSLLAVFSGTHLSHQMKQRSDNFNYPYYMAY